MLGVSWSVFSLLCLSIQAITPPTTPLFDSDQSCHPTPRCRCIAENEYFAFEYLCAEQIFLFHSHASVVLTIDDEQEEGPLPISKKTRCVRPSPCASACCWRVSWPQGPGLWPRGRCSSSRCGSPLYEPGASPCVSLKTEIKKQRERERERDIVIQAELQPILAQLPQTRIWVKGRLPVHSSISKDKHLRV